MVGKVDVSARRVIHYSTSFSTLRQPSSNVNILRPKGYLIAFQHRFTLAKLYSLIGMLFRHFSGKPMLLKLGLSSGGSSTQSREPGVSWRNVRYWVENENRIPVRFVQGAVDAIAAYDTPLRVLVPKKELYNQR